MSFNPPAGSTPEQVKQFSKDAAARFSPSSIPPLRGHRFESRIQGAMCSHCDKPWFHSNHPQPEEMAALLIEIAPHMNEMSPEAYARIAPKVHDMYARLSGLVGRKSKCCGVEPYVRDLSTETMNWCPRCDKPCEVL
jgi:hypothetical protein